jgi:ribose transport system substrate-binding protein
MALGTGIVASGCGKSDSTAKEATASAPSSKKPSTEGLTVAFPVPGPAPYVDGYFKNWDKLAKEAGVTTLKTQGDWTAAKQADQIDALIAKRPKVFVIWAADNKAIVPVLARIKAAGIPVVATNAYPEAQALSFVQGYSGPDDVLQGKIAGENMVKALGSGDVGMVRGTAGTAANENRAKGFNDAIAGSGIKVVADQNGAWGDVQKANDIVSAMLKRNKDIKGIFVQDDGMAAGAKKAADAAGRDIKIVGIGGSCAAKKLIAAGSLAATTVQDPWDDAAKAFDNAVRAATKQSVPKTTYLQPPVVTSDNVDSFDCHW